MAEGGPRPSLAEAVAELHRVISRLRAPDGCPWDREQTVASARRHLLGEAYEAVEALDGDAGSGGAELGQPCEELGDLLFQLAFLCQLYEERGEFGLADVAAGAAAKMVARHPHVFAGERIDTADEVRQRWGELKARARGEDGPGRSLLAGVPRALPALAKAHELTERAGRVGFDWPDATAVFAKLDEELAELRRAVAGGDHRAAGEELGDLLFVLANLGRKLGIDPEEALQRANAKFARRFRFIEAELGRDRRAPAGSTLGEMDRLWDEAKRRGL